MTKRLDLCRSCGSEREVLENSAVNDCHQCGDRMLGQQTPPVENLPDLCGVCRHSLGAQHDGIGCQMPGCACTVVAAVQADAIKAIVPNNAESERTNSGNCEACDRAAQKVEGRPLDQVESQDVFTKDHRVHLIGKREGTTLVAPCGAKLEAKAENQNGVAVCQACLASGRARAGAKTITKGDVGHIVVKEGQGHVEVACGDESVCPCQNAVEHQNASDAELSRAWEQFGEDMVDELGLGDMATVSVGGGRSGTAGYGKLHPFSQQTAEVRRRFKESYEDAHENRNAKGHNYSIDRDGRSFGKITEAEAPNESALRSKLVAKGAMTAEEAKTAKFFVSDKGVGFEFKGGDFVHLRCYCDECYNTLSNAAPDDLQAGAQVKSPWGNAKVEKNLGRGASGKVSYEIRTESNEVYRAFADQLTNAAPDFRKAMEAFEAHCRSCPTCKKVMDAQPGSEQHDARHLCPTGSQLLVADLSNSHAPIYRIEDDNDMRDWYVVEIATGKRVRHFYTKQSAMQAAAVMEDLADRDDDDLANATAKDAKCSACGAMNTPPADPKGPQNPKDLAMVGGKWYCGACRDAGAHEKANADDATLRSNLEKHRKELAQWKKTLEMVERAPVPAAIEDCKAMIASLEEKIRAAEGSLKGLGNDLPLPAGDAALSKDEPVAENGGGGGPYDQPNPMGCNGCDDIKAPLNKYGYCKACDEAPRANAQPVTMAARENAGAARYGSAR